MAGIVLRRRDALVALGRAMAGATAATSAARILPAAGQAAPQAHASPLTVVRPGAPTRLRIPAAGIDAPVEPVWQLPASPGDGGGLIGVAGAPDTADVPFTVGLPTAPEHVG